ncbi:MAG: EAL domain-containing protein [Acidimicrobiales bacterium]|jgi:diguanylate cyclase (GGDEF)-like protein/PAS domain S-box-containing protein
MESQPPDNEPGEALSPNYAQLVATVGDVTTVADLGGRYLYCSTASELAFGWARDSSVGLCEDDLVHPDDTVALLGGRSGRALVEPVTTSYRVRCRDGSYRWVEATSRRSRTGGGDLVVRTVRDITQRQKITAALERRATTDPLTGVANRTVLMDRLRQALRRLGRSPGGVLAVLYLDLDRFKVINDSLGHNVGDDVLLKMAERLAHHLRPADTLARLGGDEFVLVAEGVSDEAAALTLANRIIEDGRRPFALDGEEFSCTMSIGVACTADSQRNLGELLAEADLALYRAKDLGRDRAAIFDEELRTTAVDRLVTERMVRHALDDGRVVVEYQPMVDIMSGHPVGAEALVRIRDLDHGLRLPGSFLGVAEETGLLVTIDKVVLNDAVKQASTWRARLGPGFGGVAINVTARHLADSEFRQAVLDQLKAHGVPPGDLMIEVTEQVLMEASNSAMTGLRALRDLGVNVGLDDFGTRYSSLAYLRQFPLDFVKIDKSFIDDLVTDPKVRAIVGAIIVLSHALDLTVVAEGVEVPSQRQVLIDLGCDRAQGFLYGPSGAPEDIHSPVLPARRPG